MTASGLIRQSGFALLTRNTISQEEAQTIQSGSRVFFWERYIDETKEVAKDMPGVAVSMVHAVGNILLPAE